MRTSERNVGVLGLRGDGVQRIESSLDVDFGSVGSQITMRSAFDIQ